MLCYVFNLRPLTELRPELAFALTSESFTYRPLAYGLRAAAYPSALGPSTSGGTFTTPKSRAAFTASTSGPEFVLSSVHVHYHN